MAELALTNDEILHAIESSLRALGSGDTVIEPRRHPVPNETILEHFTAEAFAQLSR